MTALVVLDTSALLALRDNETGADRVAELLAASALSPLPTALGCFMSRMEVLYRVWKDEGERAGRLAHEQLLALPIRWVEASDALITPINAQKGIHAHPFEHISLRMAAGQGIGRIDSGGPERHGLVQAPERRKTSS